MKNTKASPITCTPVEQSELSKTIEARSKRFSRPLFVLFLSGILVPGLLVAIAVKNANASANGTKDDARIVAALDKQYQAAVKKNDVATMDRILADNFVLVTGSGKTYTKTDLLEDARSGHETYEQNEDSEQTVRVLGDTAIVTAKLWEKGTDNGKPFDHRAWFSDVYLRTPTGWRYTFAQSSLPLPKASN